MQTFQRDPFFMLWKMCSRHSFVYCLNNRNLCVVFLCVCRKFAYGAAYSRSSRISFSGISDGRSVIQNEMNELAVKRSAPMFTEQEIHGIAAKSLNNRHFLVKRFQVDRIVDGNIVGFSSDYFWMYISCVVVSDASTSA